MPPDFPHPAGAAGASVAYGLWQISEIMIFEKYLQETFESIVTVASSLLGLKVCSLMTIDEKSNDLHIQASFGASPEFMNRSDITMKLWEGISGRAIRESRHVEVPDVRQDERYRFPEIARRDGLVSLISIPIRAGRKILGVINGYTGEPHAFNEHEVTVLKAVANQAALAIESHRLREEQKFAKADYKKRELIEKAKIILMEKNGMKEKEADRLLQQTSKKYGKPVYETAEAVVMSFSIEEGE